MEGIEVIFWVVLALIWLISGSLLRKRSRRERERLQKGKAAYGEPEEKKEEVFAEEEVRSVFELWKREEETIPVSEQPPIVLPPVEEPQLFEPIEGKEVPRIEFMERPVLPTSPEEEELKIELDDLETLGQGILLAEILGPPRAKRPFRRIR
ncbi:hypothetical protein GTN66_04305 [bacterium]|nr:hypothetical protein [bacterium]NIN92567.1 hypothetical protein [bacterium]NIO18609.1 hypothetical protein [bacterium]NIO73624.1 hypothetical protein [bacterium]